MTYLLKILKFSRARIHSTISVMIRNTGIVLNNNGTASFIVLKGANTHLVTLMKLTSIMYEDYDSCTIGVRSFDLL